MNSLIAESERRIIKLLVNNGPMSLDVLERETGLPFNLFYLAFDEGVAQEHLRLTRENGAYWVTRCTGCPRLIASRRRLTRGESRLRILIIGENCPTCRGLFALVAGAVDLLRIGATIDIRRPIGKAQAGVRQEHTLVINRQVRRIEGGLPSIGEMRHWIEESACIGAVGFEADGSVGSA